MPILGGTSPVPNLWSRWFTGHYEVETYAWGSSPVAVSDLAEGAKG